MLNMKLLEMVVRYVHVLLCQVELKAALDIPVCLDLLVFKENPDLLDFQEHQAMMVDADQLVLEVMWELMVLQVRLGVQGILVRLVLRELEELLGLKEEMENLEQQEKEDRLGDLELVREVKLGRPVQLVRLVAQEPPAEMVVRV